MLFCLIWTQGKYFLDISCFIRKSYRLVFISVVLVLPSVVPGSFYCAGCVKVVLLGTPDLAFILGKQKSR